MSISGVTGHAAFSQASRLQGTATVRQAAQQQAVQAASVDPDHDGDVDTGKGPDIDSPKGKSVDFYA